MFAPSPNCIEFHGFQSPIAADPTYSLYALLKTNGSKVDLYTIINNTILKAMHLYEVLV